MEWLSKEEKSSSMMPYLLDLPPLDNQEPAKVTEIKEEVQPKIQAKKSKEVDIEK